MFTSVLASNSGSKLLLWLIILAIAMSAVSLFYYLRVLKTVYVTNPATDANPIKSSLTITLVVGMLAAGVVLLGCAPDLILSHILRAIQASGL